MEHLLLIIPVILGAMLGWIFGFFCGVGMTEQDREEEKDGLNGSDQIQNESR